MNDLGLLYLFTIMISDREFLAALDYCLSRGWLKLSEHGRFYQSWCKRPDREKDIHQVDAYFFQICDFSSIQQFFN